jgi:hypothetical protein
MPKTPKKKPISKAAAAELKAMENMVIKTEDFGVHIEQVTERLKAAGISFNEGTIFHAGRQPDGSRHVNVLIGSTGEQAFSPWPEWAYGVAEGALHFNKKVLVMYRDVPLGSNLMLVLCMRASA